MKNHQSNIRGKVVRCERPLHANPTLKAISAHEHRIFVKFFTGVDEFDTWWDGVKADLPDFDERLEYLDNLCEDCNAEKVQRKSWMICPECYSLNV